VVEAFDMEKEIDIVVTALAWAEDKDAELIHYTNDQERKEMREAGWRGDILYRPFTDTGPLRHKTSVKAVVLFDIPKLVKLAQTPGKHVVLVAGPCAECGKRKGPALRPLLVSPELRVWSDLVMDLPTAEQLLAPQSQPRPVSTARPRPRTPEVRA
jgi:DNA-binding transcriptional regulator LsrR (DeoR family)